MERCPICRAALNGATTCRRCRADLQQVQQVQQVAEQAAALAGAAMLSLVQGDAATARHLLARARLLHATPSTRALWQAIANEN
jgi:transcriptional regulator of aromatic amino acid metabolism